MSTQHHILPYVHSEFEALDLFGPMGAIERCMDRKPLRRMDGGFPTLSLAEGLGEDQLFDTLFIPGGFDMMPLVEDPILLQRIGQLVDHAPNVF
ncbi:hypothetical protein BDV11DRAFT_170695 [Aspergillus similis]